MKRIPGVSYLRKYPTLVFVLCVAVGTLIGGNLLNNVERSKAVGVIDRCGRPAKTDTRRQPLDCNAEKTVKGFPVKTMVNYKIIQKPIDQPAVSDTLKVRYNDARNPIADFANYLITGAFIALTGGIIMLLADKMKKHRTQKSHAKDISAKTL